MVALIELLDDRDRAVATAAACALGRKEARGQLKRDLNERPSPRVIEAWATVADEEAIVFLARIGRARTEFTISILSALDEIDHKRAVAAASGLRHWLSSSEQR